MATLFIFNDALGRFESSPPTPAMNDAKSCILWSDRRFLDSVDELSRRYDLTVVRSFTRLTAGRCSPFSAHYAGLAANFVPLERGEPLSGRLWDMRKFCINNKLFSCVYPPYSTPCWLHAELSILPPCSLTVPYPMLRPGDRGVHVFLLQRCLGALGCRCLLNGEFGEDTSRALAQFAKKAEFPTYGIVTSECWKALFYQLKIRPYRQ